MRWVQGEMNIVHDINKRVTSRVEKKIESVLYFLDYLMGSDCNHGFSRNPTSKQTESVLVFVIRALQRQISYCWTPKNGYKIYYLVFKPSELDIHEHFERCGPRVKEELLILSVVMSSVKIT